MTRAHIIFVVKKHDWQETVYQHADGYPEYVVQFLKDMKRELFKNKEWGRRFDPKYLAANYIFLQKLIDWQEKNDHWCLGVCCGKVNDYIDYEYHVEQDDDVNKWKVTIFEHSKQIKQLII